MPRLSPKGTDIVITKIDPGTSYGSGYTVEIFSGGSKVEEFTAKTKKEVEQIVREQKNKYNTDRAFQEGLQLHVDYKVDESMKTSPKKSSGYSEVSMDALDSILQKKAAQIENLLTRINDPSAPIKVYKNAEVMSSSVDVASNSIPEVETDVNQQAAELIRDKIVDYFSSPNASDSIPDNDLKQWFSQVKKIIESKSNEGYNLQTIVDRLKTMFLQEDLPGKDFVLKPIKEASSLETDKVVSKIEKQKGNPAGVEEILETEEATKASEELLDKEDKTEAELLLTNFEDAKNKVLAASILADRLASYKKVFFSDISKSKGTHNLLTFYEKWSQTQQLSPKFANLLLHMINHDISKLLGARHSSSNLPFIRREMAFGASEELFQYLNNPQYSPILIDDYVRIMLTNILSDIVRVEALKLQDESETPITPRQSVRLVIDRILSGDEKNKVIDLAESAAVDYIVSEAKNFPEQTAFLDVIENRIFDTCDTMVSDDYFLSKMLSDAAKAIFDRNIAKEPSLKDVLNAATQEGQLDYMIHDFIQDHVKDSFVEALRKEKLSTSDNLEDIVTSILQNSEAKDRILTEVEHLADAKVEADLEGTQNIYVQEKVRTRLSNFFEFLRGDDLAVEDFLKQAIEITSRSADSNQVQKHFGDTPEFIINIVPGDNNNNSSSVDGSERGKKDSSNPLLNIPQVSSSDKEDSKDSTSKNKKSPVFLDYLKDPSGHEIL